ncbi:MAG TPA: hypothetical protein DCW68_03530 [Rhodospirillaceae bacterium]|nr:MAG: hypothetical protein A2018_07610 [Alphaproteobacteria bacterium GWF2_58_20]HAU29165.1 hypothetical protein [Rhodospirillaceae bacterium]
MSLSKHVTILGVLLALSAPAHAQRTALVVLSGPQEEALARAERIQAVLLDERPFDQVDVKLDVEPAETGEVLAAFLSAPGESDDFRMALVLAPEAGLCQGDDVAPVVSAVPSLVLAPECLVDRMAFPASPAVYDMDPSGLSRDLSGDPWSGELFAGDMAFLAIPFAQDILAPEVEGLLLQMLAAGGDVSPLGLLEMFRLGLSGDGSDFTPVLYATRDLVARTVILSGSPGIGEDFRQRRQVWPQVLSLDVYAAPSLAEGAVAQLHGGYRIEPLRRDHSGRMVYVRTFSGHYGWVRVRDLGRS